MPPKISIMNDEQYAAVWQRLQEIRAQAAKAERLIDDLVSAGTRLRNEQRSCIERAAEAVARGDGVDPIDALAEAERIGRETDRARERLAVYRRAIVTCQADLQAARGAASARRRAEVAVEHRRLLKTQLRTLLEAVAANEALREFYNLLKDGDVVFAGFDGFGPHTFSALGRADPYDRLGWYLRGLLESGAVAPGDIVDAAPESFRARIRRILQAFKEMQIANAA